MSGAIFKIKDKADSTVLAQIVDPQSIEINEKLNDFASVSFFLPFNSIYATPTIINQFNRVDIYEQEGATETKIFEGVIRGYEGVPATPTTTGWTGSTSSSFKDRSAPAPSPSLRW